MSYEKIWNLKNRNARAVKILLPNVGEDEQSAATNKFGANKLIVMLVGETIEIEIYANGEVAANPNPRLMSIEEAETELERRVNQGQK